MRAATSPCLPLPPRGWTPTQTPLAPPGQPAIHPHPIFRACTPSWDPPFLPISSPPNPPWPHSTANTGPGSVCVCVKGGGGLGFGGGKEKPDFVLWEENWAFCLLGNGAEKAKLGGCRRRTKPAVSPPHSPGRSNPSPSPRHPAGWGGCQRHTRSFHSPRHGGGGGSQHGQPAPDLLPPPGCSQRPQKGSRNPGRGGGCGVWGSRWCEIGVWGALCAPPPLLMGMCGVGGGEGFTGTSSKV